VLSHLQPGRRIGHEALALSQKFAPLLAASEAGEPLEQVMRSVVRDLGYESFMYGMCTNETQPQHESRGYVWTTLPREWVALYDRNAYVEIDPRLTETWNRTTPYLWDASTVKGDWHVKRFIADAARFQIRSGVVVSFRDSEHARIVVALNSSISPVDDVRRTSVLRNLGEVMLLATTFHDIFMAHFVDRGVPPKQSGAPLSPREIQCLRMSAAGLTSEDIGVKLGISARTANFHFSNIISKLDVLNRKEAIAKGISLNIISP
jgi:DNA-binding CsgD family transcriptional regulator